MAMASIVMIPAALLGLAIWAGLLYLLVLLIRALRTYLRELFRRRYPRSALSAADLAAALDFYACGVIGVLLGSCRQPNPDPEALTDQICRLLSGEMLRQLS